MDAPYLCEACGLDKGGRRGPLCADCAADAAASRQRACALKTIRRALESAMADVEGTLKGLPETMWSEDWCVAAGALCGDMEQWLAGLYSRLT